MVMGRVVIGPPYPYSGRASLVHPFFPSVIAEGNGCFPQACLALIWGFGRVDFNGEC